MKHTINRLDIMIAYSCNVSCKGCISVSDIAREGIEPLKNIQQWIQYWSQLIDPKVVVLFGGEPLLHPRIFDLCDTVREHWPTAIIRLITNGYLFDRFFAGTWFDYEPMEIQISVHRKDHESLINQHIKQILSHRTNWTIQQHGGDNHKQLQWTSGQFIIYKSIFKDFVQPYNVVNGKMLGYDSDPAEAHAICGSPATPILYKGALYKCPPVANLMDLTGEDFYGYRPVTDVHGLTEFVQGIGCPESVCAWCPAQPQATVIDHFNIKNVYVRQKIIG
jgi:organic radical activating enzyme